MWQIFGVHLRKWWSTKDGWVDKAMATQFTSSEKETALLPFAGIWKRTEVVEKKIGFQPTPKLPKVSRLKPWQPPIG